MPENPTPQAPPPTAPESPGAPADLMASMFPGEPAPVTPVAPAAPTQPGPIEHEGTFGIDIGAAPAAPSAPASPETTPPAATEAPAPAGLSIEDFVSRHVADPEEIFKGDGRKIAQFKELRGLFEGATRDLAAAQLEISQLRQATPAGGNGEGGAPLPETDAVQKLLAEIDSLKPAAQKWQEIEARESLAQNPAFRHEFDQPRAAILREIEATASEIGLEKTDVEDFLRLDSEFKQAKWIKEHVEDDVAVDLYREKGKQFLALSNQANSVLQSEDPIAALRDWDDYSSAFATKFAAKLGEDAAKELQSATSRVVQELSGSDNPFFTTESGRGVLADLTRRASEGRGFSAEEVVESIAVARSAAAYQALAQTLQKRAMTAEAELSRLRGFAPTASPPDPMRGGGSPAPADLYGFGAGDGSGIQPMIRADQIKVS